MKKLLGLVCAVALVFQMVNMAQAKIQIAAGGYLTVGLKSDGTVIAVGWNFYGQCDVGSWTDISQIAAGGSHAVGLKPDGTVVAVGRNDYGQCNVSDWTDISRIAAGGNHTVGLKSDETVVAVGLNDYGQCDVSGWTNISWIAAGWNHTVGLKSDGTVVAVGRNDYGQCDVGGWTDISLIAAEGYHTVGLKSDGTVVAVGSNDYGQCNVSSWTNISRIAAGSYYTVGLKSDGTVVAVGRNDYGQCDVDGWTNISQIAAYYHTIGLKSDGTLVAVGNNDYGGCDVGGWTDISQIAVGEEHTVGLKSDGSVVAVGDNDYDQCNVSGWTNISQVAAYSHTVGLKSDGTVVAVGNNDYGQCNVSSWTDISRIAAVHYLTVGLKSDGTVVAVGENDYGQCNVGSWTDISQIAAGYFHTVGLKSDGAVVAAGRNSEGQCDVGSWANISQIAAGYHHTVGLKSDKTVVAVGNNDSGKCDVSSWTDISQIATGAGHTVGLKSDGTVMAVGWNNDDQCDVSSWTDISRIAAGSYYTVGLKSDGTVVAVGENYSGQCNVSSWTDISQVAAEWLHTVGLKSDGTVVAVGSNDHGQCNTFFWDLDYSSDPNTNNNPPNIPCNPSPTNGAIEQPTTLSLSWIGGDPDGDTVTYDIYFDANDETPDELVLENQSNLTYDPNTLNYNTHYYWKIIAKNQHGATTEGPVWDFYTIIITNPDISIFPTSYNFGSVDVGNSATQLFTITNIGDEDLIIENLSITGTNASDFTIQNDNCSDHTIASEGTCTVEIKFSPPTSGAKTATLSIPSNDPDTPALDVPLYGGGQQYTLTVNKEGTGTGTVTSDLVGIDCGDDCLETYNPDAIVTLAAIPDGDSIFTGWTGGGCNGTGACVVTMDEDISVTATFTLDDQPPEADAGDDQIVDEGITVTLDGSNSTDFIGTIVSYKWTQITGPSVTLADPNVEITNFVALPVGLDGTTLSFELTVEDGAGLQDYDEITITVNDNGITGFPNDAITMNCSTEEPIGIDADGGDITSLCAKDPDTIADIDDKPNNLIYGLIDMKIKVDFPGDTVTVTIYLPEAAPDGYKWYKYSAQTGWQDYSDNAVFNNDRTQITLTLTDGGIGDSDGVADGVITDPSGLGTPQPAPSSGAPAPSAGGGGCFITLVTQFIN